MAIGVEGRRRAAILGAVDDVVRVLCVCTHNRTRSVLMAGLLAHHGRAAGVPLDVSSAGFASADEPALERAVRLLADRGVDAGGHRSRRLDAADVRTADLLVTAERAHVVSVAGRWPEAYPRTFTLPELVQRAEDAGARAGRPLDAWVLAVNDGRPSAFEYLDRSDVPEIDDPTGGRPAEWARAFAEIDALTARLAGALT